MTDETVITITGNLTADPEHRTTNNGTSVVNFTVAHSIRVYDRQAGRWQDGRTSFYHCAAFNQLADNILKSGLRKGRRVIVTGSINQRQWQDDNGNKRSSFEVTVSDMGASLIFMPKNNQQSTSQTDTTTNTTSGTSRSPWDTPADPAFSAFGN